MIDVVSAMEDTSVDVQTFLLERNQSKFENEVEINLTESGVHPMSVLELLSPDELDEFLRLPINYGYTEGTPTLREAVASWYEGASSKNVLITSGASEANFLVAWTLLDPGDSLALMIPNFMQLQGIGRSLGTEVVPLRLEPELGWRLDFEKVEQALRGGVELLTIVNPNNPTGKIMPREDMRTLVELVDRHDVYLLVDEIYRGAELPLPPGGANEGPTETPSFWGMSERVIVTASTSKALAHAGLRLGWIVAQERIIHECMRRQDYTTIGTSPLCQYLGERLLVPDRRSRVLSRSRRILGENLARVLAFLEQKARGLSAIRPEAGGMVFVRYERDVNSTLLSERLRDSESVFIVAGDWFGMDGYLRIGIGGEADILEEGLRRFGRFLDTHPDALATQS